MVSLACLLLLPGILSGLFVVRTVAAPATYNQQQAGDLNVHAQLDNIMFIISHTFDGKLMNLLAEQAANHLNRIGFRQAASKPLQSAEKPLEATIYETEDEESGKEPYHVEIFRIEKDDAVARNKPTEKLKEAGTVEVSSVNNVETGSPLKNLKDGPAPQVSIDGKRVEKKSKSLWGNQKSRGRLADGPTEVSRTTVHVDSTVENLAQADDLTVKEVSKATRPGITLKKQLSKKEQENLSTVSEERNELGNKADELVLLGGGIENCGPGRYRDKSGICQNDKDFY
ncbi:PREDICTED: uncharacterized protein LOC107194543 [Dufourea novaeangliae]|uniref:Uncharacterized protein n=1 Tax=Dufourea novaeangliae TaxID=178035 RepID=A0A154P304_DUFNO|nr:PREDICTED: uncharacterized protein LOC107194543 [Dufourea novaeangliae]KZC06305.1 hypothetical protein WN55_10214 [Dufourea novaeangliae]